MLFVWPSDDPATWVAAEATPLPLVPENDDPTWFRGADDGAWGYQLMPVDFAVAQVSRVAECVAVAGPRWGGTE